MGFFSPEEGRLVLPVKTQDTFVFAALLLMFNFVLRQNSRFGSLKI